MRLIFFALLAVNVAVFILQLTVWRPPVADAPTARQVATGAARLQLLTEAAVGSVEPARLSGRRGGSGGPAAPASGRVAEQGALCDMVGPFPALLQAEYLVEHLQALEVAVRVRELDVPEGVGYWVYLAPEASRKEALARLHEVQAKQIDSYMIPRGELANGISFGMFTRQELAEARLQEMRELGYAAEVKEITRTHKEIWVVLDANQGQKIAEKAWVELLESENGIEKQQKYCQGVAST